MKHHRFRLLSIFAAALMILALCQPAVADHAAAAAPGDENWKTGFALPGMDGEVYAMARDSAGNLYAGGAFTTAGGAFVSNIAMWDGSRWSALVSGADGPVIALAITSDDHLYAGGYFTSIGGVAANNLAVWNGASWAQAGGGVNDYVRALEYDADTSALYVGGTFTQAGTVNAKAVARLNLNNSTWSAFGSGIDGEVYALEYTADGTLYAGGDFPSLANIAQWNSATQAWTTPGNGFDHRVRSLRSCNSVLYAGGEFQASGATIVDYIAHWNGTQWVEPGGGTDGPVRSLACYATTLYVGGEFTHAGGTGAGSIATWNGSAWSAFGAGVHGDVYAVLLYSRKVGLGLLRYTLLGGSFGRAGDVPAANIAGATGNALWFNFQDADGPGALLGGLYWQGYSLASDSHGAIYAGTCTTKDSINTSHVLRWDGAQWVPLGSGIISEPGCVDAMAVGPDDVLYASATFFPPDASMHRLIARWDGSEWTTIGDPVGNNVTALAVSPDGTLYAGGMLQIIGTTHAEGIAKWNGSTWSQVGAGINGTVYTIAIHPLTGDVYAGGLFTETGDGVANHIARFDTTWHALGSGTNERVKSIVIDGAGRVYAAGSFTSPGSHLAYWNGSWHAMGSGANAGVTKLAVDGLGRVFAGGNFTTLGGASAEHVGYWNGARWSAMGSGIYSRLGAESGNYIIYSMLASGRSGMYFGGLFSRAGEQVSNNVAYWNDGKNVYLPALSR